MRAKAALAAAGIPFATIDLTDNLGLLDDIKRQSGLATVPQVFVGGELLGGATEMLAALEDGSLAARLAEAAAAGRGALPPALQQAVSSALDGSHSGGGWGDAQRAKLEKVAERLRAARLGGGGGAFTLAAALAWARESGLAGSRAAGAADLLAQLQAAQLLTAADPGGAAAGAEDPAITPELAHARPQLRLRLVAELPAPARLSAPLNGHFRWFGPARPAAALSAELRRRMLELFDRHVTAEGRKVDYAALRTDPDFRRFVDATAELQKARSVDPSTLDRTQALAFWINTYNILIVHATAVLGPGEGTLGRLRWFDSVSYEIGGSRWSSNDIEHGVLRGNKPSPANPVVLLGLGRLAGPTFGRGDPRAALAMSPVDARIHFALNCGAASCPPVKVYTPESLEAGLEAAARAFCESEVQVDEAARELSLSSILKWYGGDFGSKEQLLEFLAAHVSETKAAALRRLMATASAEQVHLKFRPYDWSTNSK